MTQGVKDVTGVTIPNPAPIEEVAEGQSVEETVIVTGEYLQAFAAVSRDSALAHVDEAHARAMGYEGVIVHGMLVALPFSRLLGMFLPGSNTVIQQFQVDALLPTYVGDRLTYKVTVDRVIAAVRTVVLKLTVHDQASKLVMRGRTNCTFRR